MSIDIWCPPLMPGREQLLSSPVIRTAYQHEGGTSRWSFTHHISTALILSLHTRQMAHHQTRAYPSFCSMSRLGIFLLPSRWDKSLSQGYNPALNSPVAINTPGWKEAMRKSFLSKNTTQCTQPVLQPRRLDLKSPHLHYHYRSLSLPLLCPPL